MTSEPMNPKSAVFKATLDKSLLKTYEQKVQALLDGRLLVPGEVPGAESEPDSKDLEPRHVPGSLNMPFTDSLTAEDLEESLEELRATFQEKNVDLSKPLIATCCKGVTACHTTLATYLCESLM